MLKICLTYDYELFLGENLLSYDEILFSPTEKIAEIMQKKGVRGTFFADVLSAMAYRNADLPEFSCKFDRQVKELTQSGQDVQLHLHTSWLCAKKEKDQLLLSDKGYKIHEFGFDDTKDDSVQKIVADGIRYLNNICMEVKPDYKCVAYRAGGFSVQPEDQLFKVLLEQGVVIDSSVVPGLKAPGEVNAFDFTNVPQKLNWYIDPEKGISTESEGGIFEVPVATARPRLLECIKKPKSKRSLPPAPKRGTYVRFSEGNTPKKPNKLIQLYHSLFDYRYVSLDTRYYEMAFNDLLGIYKRYDLANKDGYVCLICHPKLADDVRVENIARLIDKVNEHKDKFTFVTMSDIYKEINDQ